MKEVSINPAGFDWGNLGWVPRSFSVEGSSTGKQKQLRVIKAPSILEQEGDIHPQKMESLKKHFKRKLQSKNICRIQFNLEKSSLLHGLKMNQIKHSEKFTHWEVLSFFIFCSRSILWQIKSSFWWFMEYCSRKE